MYLVHRPAKIPFSISGTCCLPGSAKTLELSWRRWLRERTVIGKNLLSRRMEQLLLLLQRLRQAVAVPVNTTMDGDRGIAQSILLLNSIQSPTLTIRLDP